MTQTLSGPELPPGYGTVNPFVAVRGPGGAEAFMQFVADVFDGRETPAAHTVDADGLLIHAEIRIGDSTVMLCDAKPRWTFTPALLQGGGFARIYGPEGTPLGDDLAETEEGMVVADLDFSMIAIAKSAADPVGHYSRPDVMRLLINRAPNPAVVDREVPSPAFVDADHA